ncbi:hypothetical protein ACFQ07_02205, partial [Actinomadura adrarensis]
LADAVQAHAETEIGRRYLEPAPGEAAWQVVGEEIAGRLEADLDANGPLTVIVDGHALSWEQLGQALASSFEGWRFRIQLDDPSLDLRSATDWDDPHPDGAH